MAQWAFACQPLSVVPDFQGSRNTVHSRVRQRADRRIAGDLSCRHHGEARAKLGESYESIDRLDWMREQMLTLQRALERVESNKRGQQIQKPTVKLTIKQL